MTPDQIAKLPKAAQRYIAELQEAQESASRIARELTARQKPSRIYYEIGSRAKADRVRVYIPDDESIILVTGGTFHGGTDVESEVRLQLKGDTIELNADDSLIAQNSASNNVVLKQRRMWEI